MIDKSPGRSRGGPLAAALLALAAGALTWLHTPTLAVADPGPDVHVNAWINEAQLPSEVSSQDGAENTSLHPTRTNLCEGVTGIPGGLDPGWVRVNGSPNPATPFVQASGQLLPDLYHALHKAGPELEEGHDYKTNPFAHESDNTYNHYMHDLNVFLLLDPPDRGLLADGNFDSAMYDSNEIGMLEIEWERGAVPRWAWPAMNDRITVWGTHIYDCGHGDDPDYIDVVHYRTEIHPPVGWVIFRNLASTYDVDQYPGDAKRNQSPWQWYDTGNPPDHQGMGAIVPLKGPSNASVSSGLFLTPVQTTVADAFFSDFGGNVVEALNGCDDEAQDPASPTTNATCFKPFSNSWQWMQQILNQDYTFFVPAPPKPTPDAQMIWSAEDRCDPQNPDIPVNPGNPGDDVEGAIEAGSGDTAYNIGSATCLPDDVIEATGLLGEPGIQVTVKGASSGIAMPANRYIAFGKRYKVSWDYVPPPADRVRTFNVNFDTLQVYDDADDCGEDGEWVMGIRVNDDSRYPIDGIGDGGDPFWETGALDDAKAGAVCASNSPPQFKQYAINEFYTAHVVPGEAISVTERSFDLDNHTNDTTPIVHAYRTTPGVFTDGVADDTLEGGHTITYTISDVTKDAPDPGFLVIGTPQYGPAPETDGRVRVSGSTPIYFDGSPNAFELEYKVWKDGDPEPTTWTYDTTIPFQIDMSGLPDGNYQIKFAPVSSFGIVSIRQTVAIQLDATPPVLTLPPDMKVDATSVNGANVTYTVTASDNMPGPVSITCNPASGSFFPVKQITIVNCFAEDAVGNDSFGNFHVDVESPFGYVHDFVALGLSTMDLGTFENVVSGNVGAFDRTLTPGGQQLTEVTIGAGSQLIGGPKVAADTVRLDDNVLAGEIYSVDPVAAGQGSIFAPRKGYVPLFLCLPNFPAFMAFGANVDVKVDTQLPSGNYGDLKVQPGKTLTLLGGTYVFKSITLGDKSSVLAIRPTIVEVSLRVDAGTQVTIGPSPSGSDSAHDIVFYVQAGDAPKQMSWQTNDKLWMAANVYAKNGTISIGRSSLVIGALIGNDVVIGNGTTLRIDSAFDCPYPLPPRDGGR